MNQLIRLSQRMAVGLACTVFLCGCPVTVDSSRNATPSTITWSVIDKYTNQALPGSPFPANYTITIDPIVGSYFVVMHATTPSGPKAASVRGTASWTCKHEVRGGGTQNNTRIFGSKLVSVSPDASNQVDNPLLVVWGMVDLSSISFGEFGCGDPDWVWWGGQITLNGSAQNFANMSTHGTLSFNIRQLPTY